MDIQQFFVTVIEYLRYDSRAHLYEWAWAFFLGWTAVFLAVALVRKRSGWLAIPVFVSCYVLFHAGLVLTSAYDAASGSYDMQCLSDRDDFCVDDAGYQHLREAIIVRDEDGFSWAATSVNALRDAVAWCQYAALLLGVSAIFGLMVAAPFWLFGLLFDKKRPAEAAA